MTDKESIFLEDLQIAYAVAILDIFSRWIHDDDGANDYDAVGKKQSYIVSKNILVVYNPDKQEGWKEKGVILLLASKESGFKIDGEMFRKAQPLLKQVEDKLIDSYNSFVDKFGCWIEPTGPTSVEGILSASKPLCWERNILRLHFRMKFLLDGPVSQWVPVQLLNWMKTLPAYRRYLEDMYQAERAKAELWLQEFNRVLVQRGQEPSKYTPETLQFTLGASPYLMDSLKKQIADLHIPEVDYFKEGNTFIRNWVNEHKTLPEKSLYFSAKKIPTGIAVPIRSNISGVKRKASSAL